MESVPTARAVRRLNDILRQRVIPRLCVIFARPNPLLVLRYTTQHPWERTVPAFVWKSRNSPTRLSDIPVRVIAARCNRRMENLYRRPSSSIGNRDFDKANWLKLGRSLDRERVDQQALWPRMAGGAKQGADDVSCELSALHQAETFRHPCILIGVMAVGLIAGRP